MSNHGVTAGDLLIASLGEELPRACLAPPWLGPAIVKADCIRVRLTDSVDSRWVMYALQAPASRRWAKAHLHGVGRPRLGLKVVRQIPIPLPERSEQRRIVDIIEDHLSRLDAADGVLVSADARATILQGVHLGSLIACQSSRSVRLGDLLIDIEAGRSLGGPAQPAGPDEWGIIRVSAMTWGRFRAEENKAVPTPLVNNRHEIHKGDLLLSRANTSAYVGATVLVDRVRPKLLLSDKSLRLVPKPGIDPRWLAAVLSAPGTRRRISALATGTKDSMRNISQASLRSLSIPEATREQQQHLVEGVVRLRDATDRLHAGIGRSRDRSLALRRGLLTAAFSGRLTGSAADAEIIEERVEP